MGPWLIKMYKTSFKLQRHQELTWSQLRQWKKLRMNINATMKTLKPSLLVYVKLSAALLLITVAMLSHFPLTCGCHLIFLLWSI